MKSTCRAASCREPSERLPEMMEFLEVPLCDRHIQVLQEVAKDAPSNLEEYAMLVEARRLIYPPEGAALTLLKGGYVD